MRTFVCLVLFLFLFFKSNSQKLGWNSFDAKIFEIAKSENKFVLLNIGASWCHWCHVMNDSTYHNPEVLKFLNNNFILSYENQDERPDLFAKYKDYGWPAIILFDNKGNELKKLSGYFNPREFKTILNNVISASYIPEKNLVSNSDYFTWNDSIEKFITDDYKSYLDFSDGGFLMYQKYIDLDAFEFAIRNYKKDKDLEKWMEISIQNSFLINDTVWGGVYQYSTKQGWYFPHYEKLLSIQARYIKIYALHYAEFRDFRSLNAIMNIKKYLDRFLKSKSGLYYNSQDADSKKGIHSFDFFRLSNVDRMKLETPPIDTNSYCRESAFLAESFLYAWIATGNKMFLDEAKLLTSLIIEKFKSQKGFLHNSKQSPEELGLLDNISVAKLLVLMYSIAQQKIYKDEISFVAEKIIENFRSEDFGYYAYKSIQNPIKPTKLLSENIELARVFNKISYILNNNNYKLEAKKIFRFIMSKNVISSIISEPAIILLHNEIEKEPLKFVFIRHQTDTNWNGIFDLLWKKIPDKFLLETVDVSLNDGNYKEMVEASANLNCLFCCTSNRCSSPIYSLDDIDKLLFYIDN